MKLLLRVQFLLWLAMGMQGCSHLEKRQPTGLTPVRFLQLQQDRRKAFSEVTAKLSLRYDGVKESVSGRGRYVSGGKDTHRLEVRDPLGRLHFLVSLYHKEFQAQYPRQARAYSDIEGGKKYFRSVAGIPLDFRGLVEVAIGVIPSEWSKNAFDRWEWEDAEGLYLAAAKVGNKEVECKIDGSTGSLVSLSVREPGSSAEVLYSDMEPCCNGFDTQQSIARVARIRWPRSKATFEFEWGEIKKLNQFPQEAFFKPIPEEGWKVTRF